MSSPTQTTKSDSAVEAAGTAAADPVVTTETPNNLQAVAQGEPVQDVSMVENALLNQMLQNTLSE